MLWTAPPRTRVPLMWVLLGHPKIRRSQGMQTTTTVGLDIEKSVLDRPDLQRRCEHERMRDHRVVDGIRILHDVEILLHGSLGVSEEWELSTNTVAELVDLELVVRRYQYDARICDAEARGMHPPCGGGNGAPLGQPPARKVKHHRVRSLQVQQLVGDAVLVWQFVVGKAGSDFNVAAHVGPLSGRCSCDNR